MIPALVLAALWCAPGAQAIVAGTQASANEYPFQARVVMNAPSGNYSCGASIRDATHIVTAAHCVYVDDTLLAPQNVSVGYGSFDRSALTPAPVAEVRMPAAYLSDASFDVAVLELATPLSNFNGPSVKPIPLGSAAALATGVGAEANAVATGWGNTSFRGTSPRFLQEVPLPLRADTICSTFPMYAGQYEPDRTVCAGGKGTALGNNPDTCQGDSGGPLALNSGSGLELVGITSYGYQCGNPLTPAAYTESSDAAIRGVIDGTAPGLLRGSQWAPPASGGAPAVTTPVAQAPSPPPPVVATRDTTRPTARVSRLTCTKKRRCSFRIATADRGGSVRKLSARVTRRVRTCKRRGDFRVCKVTTRKKTLKPRRIRGGFAFTAKLSKATYKLSAVATDAAGNRSRAASRTFRVR